MKKRHLLTVCVCAFAVNSAQAVDLLMDFQKATTYDPTYQTALAELQSNKASANQSYTAYAPTANYSTQRIQTDTSNRTTWTVTQPLINYEALSTFRMAQPRTGFAEATFLTKQQDLATRLLKAANAIILANENIKLNDSKIKSLDQQYVAAKRKLELGQGTITDQRDIEVKFAQSKSAQVGYKSQLETAAKQYAAITGERPNVSEFVLPEKHFPTPLKPALDYVDLAFQNSPSILAARYSERVAELDVQRATGSLLPTFSTSYTASKSAGVENKYSGVVLNLPLGASTFFARQGVQANYLKSKETRRDTEEKARVDVEKLVAQIGTSFESINIQLDAIKAAELSVEANVKSYEGGVRSAVDVLNATQTVFQVKSEYVTAVTSQAENLLSLMNLTTTNPDDSLRASYKYLFSR
jgi:protease secretion system outer membrane protein